MFSTSVRSATDTMRVWPGRSTMKACISRIRHSPGSRSLAPSTGIPRPRQNRVPGRGAASRARSRQRTTSTPGSAVTVAPARRSQPWPGHRCPRGRQGFARGPVPPDRGFHLAPGGALRRALLTVMSCPVFIRSAACSITAFAAEMMLPVER